MHQVKMNYKVFCFVFLIFILGNQIIEAAPTEIIIRCYTGFIPTKCEDRNDYVLQPNEFPFLVGVQTILDILNGDKDQHNLRRRSYENYGNYNLQYEWSPPNNSDSWYSEWKKYIITICPDLKEVFSFLEHKKFLK